MSFGKNTRECRRFAIKLPSVGVLRVIVRTDAAADGTYRIRSVKREYDVVALQQSDNKYAD